MDEVSWLQRQRLLEGWRPLAQEINQRYGWHLEAGALESLILAAAPRLSDIANAEGARMIFCWLYHTCGVPKKGDECCSMPRAAYAMR